MRVCLCLRHRVCFFRSFCLHSATVASECFSFGSCWFGKMCILVSFRLQSSFKGKIPLQETDENQSVKKSGFYLLFLSPLSLSSLNHHHHHHHRRLCRSRRHPYYAVALFFSPLILFIPHNPQRTPNARIHPRSVTQCLLFYFLSCLYNVKWKSKKR